MPSTTRPSATLARRALLEAATDVCLVTSAAAMSPAVAVATPAGVAAAAPFPVGARPDYQIGGPYAPAPGVGIVMRDREAAPVPGAYNVCYVNGFQTQPSEIDEWRSARPHLLLKDSRGREVVDGAWGETLFDIRTEAKRTELAGVIDAWFAGCAAKGFQAVELDNLDSWTRSKRLITMAQTKAFARLLTASAHQHGLLIGQKNAAELAPVGRSLGFDFAVVEQCEVYTECSDFTDVYGRAVIEIEYTTNDEGLDPQAVFAAMCRARGSSISFVMRDMLVVPAGHPDYRVQWCS